MKTAISLPADLFEAASRCAAEMGVSRSQFFADAARRYLGELERASLSTHIDEALVDVGLDDSSRMAVARSRRRLLDEDDW